ncbi:unnamed protein product, partial [Rotaria sp. Silwood1]
MVRKKSTLSKVKKRKEVYKRQLKADAIPSDCVNFVNKNMQAISSDVIKYHNNNDFREKQKARVQTHILVKYRSNTNFRAENNERAKIRILNKYHNNTKFRDEYRE